MFGAVGKPSDGKTGRVLSRFGCRYFHRVLNRAVEFLSKES